MCISMEYKKNGGCPMNCHYCGTPLHDNEIFCRHCGTRQLRDPQPEPETAVMEEIPAAEAEPVPEMPAASLASYPVVNYKKKTFDWHPYGAPVKEESLLNIDDKRFNDAPKLQLPVKRSLAKMILLGILTLGIYPIVIFSRMVTEVNLVASRYDGKRSMPFFAMLTLAPFTLGIHSLVWIHKLCSRMGNELRRRNISYVFGARDFWIWGCLLSCLCSICLGGCIGLAAMGYNTMIVIWVLLAAGLFAMIGPFVFIAKLMRAINGLNEDFNRNG